MYWNGRSWKRARDPAPGYFLTGVAAGSARSAWAIGYNTDVQNTILRWNGTAWRPAAGYIPPAGDSLFGVAAVSATNAWVAGGSADDGIIIERWDSTAWRQVPSPIGGSILALAATSATNAWAVGENQVSHNVYKTLIVRVPRVQEGEVVM